MLSKYIQAPYIETLFGLATPALIISVIYLFVLGVFLVFAKNKGILKIVFVNFRGLMRGERNKIIISIIGYIVFIFSCINLPEFLGEDNILLGISGTYLKFETLVYLLLFAFLCTAFLNNTNRETHKGCKSHLSLLNMDFLRYRDSFWSIRLCVLEKHSCYCFRMDTKWTTIYSRY